jgi:hypothetical protein
MYLLFTGDIYYPSGGWRDFEGAFASLEQAREYAREIDCDWWHIVLGDEIVESKG